MREKKKYVGKKIGLMQTKERKLIFFTALIKGKEGSGACTERLWTGFKCLKEEGRERKTKE